MGASDLRPLSAGGALIFLFTIFSVLIAHTKNLVIANKTIDYVMVGVFLPLVVIPHHRTVFLAAILGLFLLFELHRRKVLFVIKAGIKSAILFAVICVAFITAPKFEHIFMKALAGIADPHSDDYGVVANGRMAKAVSRTFREASTVGEGGGQLFQLGPWGTGSIVAQRVKVGPHNAYVEIVLKFGLLGLAIYVLLAFSFFRRMFVARKKLPPGPARAYIEMSIVNFGAAQALNDRL